MAASTALIRRDFIATLRLRRSFILLMLVVGICLIVTAFAWPRGTVGLHMMGQYSREMFGFLAVLQLLAASVFPPGLAALAFAEERRLDTLDQLRLSLITTGGLVLAKLVSAVGLMALFFLAVMPALGVLLFLVGISVADVVVVGVAVLTTALMGASIGLLCAVKFRRPVVALVASYIGTGLAMGGVVLVAVLFLYVFALLLDPFGVEGVFRHLGNSSIFSRFMRWLEQFTVDIFVGAYAQVGRNSGMAGRTIGRFVAYRMVVSAGCVFLAAWMLRKPPKPARIPRGKPIDDPEALRRRRRQFPYYLIDPLRRRAPIPDHANPIFVREWRHGLGARAHVAIRIFVVAFVSCLFFNLSLNWPGGSTSNYQESLRVTLLIEMVATAAIVQVLVAGVMSKEREHGNLDLLRLTLLSNSEIIRGKLGAAFTTTGPVLLAVLLSGGFLLFAVATMGLAAAAFALVGFATLFTCVWFTLTLALCISVYTRTIAGSLTVGFVANALIYGGPLFIVLLTDQWSLPFGLNIQREIARLSPIFAYALFNWGPVGADYRDSLSVHGGLLVILLAYIVAGFVLLTLARRRLDGLAVRDF